jgi:hypothetical protein
LPIIGEKTQPKIFNSFDECWERGLEIVEKNSFVGSHLFILLEIGNFG